MAPAFLFLLHRSTSEGSVLARESHCGHLPDPLKVAEYTCFLFDYLYKKCTNHKVQHV
jgi:hypothetical protein